MRARSGGKSAKTGPAAARKEANREHLLTDECQSCQLRAREGPELAQESASRRGHGRSSPIDERRLGRGCREASTARSAWDDVGTCILRHKAVVVASFPALSGRGEILPPP